MIKTKTEVDPCNGFDKQIFKMFIHPKRFCQLKFFKLLKMLSKCCVIKMLVYDFK